MTSLSPKDSPVAPASKPGPSLSARAFVAGIWTVGVRLLSRGVDFITLLVLARFLGPADFGLVAMAMTVVFIVEAILDGRQGPAVTLARLMEPFPLGWKRKCPLMTSSDRNGH